MGLSFQSISFRRPHDRPWDSICTHLKQLFFRYGIPVTDLHLDEDRPAYGYCTNDYDRMILQQTLLTRLSAITGDYVVGVTCVDSDFMLLVLLKDGQEIDSGGIGVSDFADMLNEDISKLSLEAWSPLLKDPSQEAALQICFDAENFVLIEDAARELTRLTGLPILDEAALFAQDEWV